MMEHLNNPVEIGSGHRARRRPQIPWLWFVRRIFCPYSILIVVALVLFDFPWVRKTVSVGGTFHYGRAAYSQSGYDAASGKMTQEYLENHARSGEVLLDDPRDLKVSSDRDMVLVFYPWLLLAGFARRLWLPHPSHGGTEALTSGLACVILILNLSLGMPLEQDAPAQPRSAALQPTTPLLRGFLLATWYPPSISYERTVGFWACLAATFAALCSAITEAQVRNRRSVLWALSERLAAIMEE